ncbi:hypothetical protein ERO13_A13G097700v2 [Gossypium hirsutum]|uniref:SHSP domain-containing protein n=4 Tax=Gossypium TaxID=3633 RepID=A0A1U8IBR7_GOSHI|nr:uncharacterized protein LOC107894871 [Gossypium hirsutum]KAB2048442.1 hypothetical protein ES319_A13G113300v1 [Gossypium barbadense]KAG4165893.1 hypothetical protein ERO13_A13G097700v2 [Gossypium hirsutum]TYH91521.1 hypothetical protein ES332_A13G121500v1 [Gossypium tomentosum]TYJ00891.1 hypothetical protein E1A91_A13G116200v1 [Gossypium mustelinum]
MEQDYVEPYCQWKREKGYDAIDIELHGFNIDDVKVALKQIEGKYMISIMAEDPRCLHKRIEIPNDIYNLEQIRALFGNGKLNIELPKKVESNKLEILMPKLEFKKILKEDMKNKFISAVECLYANGKIPAFGFMLIASGLFAYKNYIQCYGI